jgi:hypothetical protein
MPIDLDKDEQKAVVKEALSEWLDKQFATLGKWTFAGVGSVAVAGLLYAYIRTKGFVN